MVVKTTSYRLSTISSTIQVVRSTSIRLLGHFIYITKVPCDLQMTYVRQLGLVGIRIMVGFIFHLSSIMSIIQVVPSINMFTETFHHT